MAYWNRDSTARGTFRKRISGGRRTSRRGAHNTYQSIRYPPPPPKPRVSYREPARPKKRSRSPFSKPNKRTKFNNRQDSGKRRAQQLPPRATQHRPIQQKKIIPKAPSISFKLERCILASGNASTPFGQHERLFSGFYESQLVATFNPSKRTVYLAARQKNTAPFGLNFHVGLLSTVDTVKESFEFEQYLEKLEREQEIHNEKEKLESVKQEKEKLIEELTKEQEEAEEGTFSLEKKTKMKRSELELLETEGKLQKLDEELDQLSNIPEPTFELDMPEPEENDEIEAEEIKSDDVMEVEEVENDEEEEQIEITEDTDDDLIQQMEESEGKELVEESKSNEANEIEDENKETLTPEEIPNFKVKDLRNLCHERSLLKSGKKKDLVKRLQDYLNEKAKQLAEEEIDVHDDAQDDENLEIDGDLEIDDDETIEVDLDDESPAVEDGDGNEIEQNSKADDNTDDPIQIDDDDDVMIIEEDSPSKSNDVETPAVPEKRKNTDVVDLTLDDDEVEIDPDQIEYYRIVFGFKKPLPNQVRSSIPAARNAACHTQLVILDLVKPDIGYKKVDEGVERFLSHCCPGLRNTWAKKEYLHKTVGRLLKETVDAKKKDHELKVCSNGCGEVLRIYEMENHETKKCPLRLKECLYCKSVVIFKDMKDHIDVCPDFPVTCPNKCTVGKVKRKELQAHIADDCELTVLPCDYVSFGCKETFQRKHHSQHLQKCLAPHLQMVSDAYFNLQEHTAVVEEFLKEKFEDFPPMIQSTTTPEEEPEMTEIIEITESNPSTEEKAESSDMQADPKTTSIVLD